MRTIRNMEQNRYLRKVGMLLLAAALVAGSVGCVPDRDPDPAPPPHNPEIRDWYDLDAIRYYLDQSYVLMNNLDANTPGYVELTGPTANDGKGWEPIGDGDDLFTGTFDGQEYEIRDVFVDRPNEAHVGLFGYVGEGAVIENVGVVSADVTGRRDVGGLAGNNLGAIGDSYATGSVTGDVWNVGGLVGRNGGTVSHSHFSGSVSGGASVGGLVGWNDWDSTVSNSHSSGSVTGEERVGGLVGDNYDGDVMNSYSTGTVTGENNVGGLVGTNRETVRDSYGTGSVTGEERVGGLVGDNYWGDVSNSYSTGTVTGNDYVGGLVGYNRHGGHVSNSHSTSEVTGEERVGGLVGRNSGTVSHSYSSGSVSGDSWVGGLVGDIYVAARVTDSYSTASVTGHSYVGGLVGHNFGGTVRNSYFTGTVTGEQYVGGLVGYSRGDVSNSYSTGTVTGEQYVGGLVGYRDERRGFVINSFWDVETSGMEESDGGTGKTTAEMMEIATFTDTETEGLDEPWDMVAVADPDQRNPGYIWNIVDGQGYPFLSWQSVG